MADSNDTVRLVRSGHDPVDILPSQVTPLSIARIFSLDTSTVWLREQYGSRAFFPDAMNVKFDLPPDIAHVSLSLIVEGSDPAVPGTSSGSASSVHVTTPVVSRPAPLSAAGTRNTQTLNVKVIQATMKRLPGGKCEFLHLGQTFVDVTEATANVNYIRSVVQKRWGFEYVLVTADGLEIEDSSGTQGFKFWKVGSRKIFAISEEGKQKVYRKKAIISESDSEDEFQQVKKRRHTDLSKAPQILSEIQDIRKDLKSLFQISRQMKLPPGLHRHLREAFKCHICCNSPITPPVIFSRCCKQIIGCQACVDQWYGGEEGVTRTCPLCRGERAYADTSILKGLDDLLKSIAPLINYRPDQSEEEEEFPAVSLR